MTRPPVGSTGTLDDLQVEPGDVVKCITIEDGYVGLGDIFTIDARGYAVSAKIDAFTPQADVDYGRTYTLISRANPDQPAHIITHEGRQYDMTALETPFGLLPEPVQKELRQWRHGFQRYATNVMGRASWANAKACGFPDAWILRAKPAPAETRVQCYRGEYYKPKEHGTCIKNPDGSIDWASWEDAE